MTTQHKAGLIPYRKNSRGVLEFLFMISSDPKFGGDKPMISKGGVDDGETSIGAALREAHEELGLRCENLKDLPRKIWCGLVYGLNSTYMLEVFIAEVKTKKGFDIPHYETKETIWMTADDFFKCGRLSHFEIIQTANKILQPAIAKFNSKENIIYLDMDGVLADFDAFLMKEMGRTFPHSVGPVGDKEMWNFLMTVPELYFKLPPTEYCFKLWELAHQLGNRVEILTALPRRSTIPSAEIDKLRWVKKYFGDDAIVNFGPYSKDKWKYAKPGDILVDDRVSNIQEWETLGKAIGILHTDFKNTERELRLFTQG